MKVKKTRFGYYELSDKPSPEQLNNYYSEKYYQNQGRGYSKKYSEEELIYINNKIEQKYSVIKNKFEEIKNKRFLDIGSGEGAVALFSWIELL